MRIGRERTEARGAGPRASKERGRGGSAVEDQLHLAGRVHLAAEDVHALVALGRLDRRQRLRIGLQVVELRVRLPAVALRIRELEGPPREVPDLRGLPRGLE